MSDHHGAPISGNNYANRNGNGNGNGAPLNRTESLSISPELFEKLYLSPQNAVKGDLRKTFGNPTPLYVSLFYHWGDIREVREMNEC